jgi:trehalose 6-phosphate phosphatase
MEYLLSQAFLPLLVRLARERTLCAFDFDGTLSPIVEHPDRACMRVRTRDLLRRLAALYPCVVISGRSRADVLGKLGGVETVRVIGNHGAETEKARDEHQRVEQWQKMLEPEISHIPGLRMENKGLSLAVHYRQSSPRMEARRRILAATRKLEHVQVFGGKQVINVMVDDAPDKGDALAAERDRLGCNWALYVGDDEEDEKAFALDGNIVSVRIGKKLHSCARYYLRSQREIDQLLSLLVRLREP